MYPFSFEGLSRVEEFRDGLRKRFYDARHFEFMGLLAVPHEIVSRLGILLEVSRFSK